MIGIAAKGISVNFNAAIGQIAEMRIEDAKRRIAPLHTAPWVGRDEPMPDDAPPHMAHLGGDFFCAPFGVATGEVPLHGWTANAPWEVETGEGFLSARLSRRINGADVTKTLTLRDGHPFIYQEHAFEGGEGALPVANHANLSVAHGAVISTSRKAVWESLAEPLEADPERGRSALIYPAHSTDATRFPGRDGPVDLTRYPWGPRHEDFVIGIEARDSALGWTAVVRPEEGDVYLSLRNPRELPMTMLWHSNGGRDFAPWSGRHFGCLGVEEGAAGDMLSLTSESDLPGPGALALSPGHAVSVRHAIGAVAWPTGERVASVKLVGDGVRVDGEKGHGRVLPFDAAFLRLPEMAEARHDA